MLTAHWRELARDTITPSRLIPALSSGFVVGLLIIIVQLSLATLIFAGPLASFAPAATGLTLFGSFVMGLTVALFSGFPTSVCLPEDAPAAILATVAVGIATSLTGDVDPRAAFATVGAAIAISTLASGVLFLVMGRFGLGKLMRFMPYPVVGGFLAGIGWLLVQGSFSIMTGISLSITELPQLLTVDTLLLATPGIVLALTLLGAMKRWNSVFTLPGVLMLALAAFAVFLAATGQSVADAARNGLLLGGMPESGGLWPVFDTSDLARIRWSALLPQLPQLATIPLASAISFLLIASGIETAARRDLNLKHELYLNGVANLIGGSAGSLTGYTALSFSMLGPKTGSDSRLVGVTAALLCGFATFFGAALLSSFPRFILGGMVLFLGVATLLDWVVAARHQVSRSEYVLILIILCAVAFFGFLAGVGVGLIMATLVFVVKYSRLPVVRKDSDARATRSARHRPLPDQIVLHDNGGSVRILHVMGYLFFGSANSLASTVGKHLEADADVPTHLIVDFTDVDGFDSSAVNCFLRILQRCAAAGCQVVFAQAPASLERQMRRAAPEQAAHALYLADLDHALEYCEDAVLESQRADSEAQRDHLFDRAVDDLLLQLEENERFEALIEALGERVKHRSFAAGQTIVAQGDPMPGICLFVAGQAEEIVRDADGSRRRLRTIGAGDMAGQMTAAATVPADIVARGDCALAFLPMATLREIEESAPSTALAFYQLYIARHEKSSP